MNECIKVLLVTGSFGIGGLETVAMNIVRYSDRKKFSFDFLVYGQEEYANEKEAIELGCRVFRVPFPHNTPFSFERNVREIIRNNGPYEVVHCHNLFNCGFVALAAYKEGVPVRISHCHTNRVNNKRSLIRVFYEWYMRMLIKRYSTDFFACSKDAASYLFGKDYINKTYIMRNGIDIDKFKFNPLLRDKYRKQFSLDDNSLVIGQIGTLRNVKNHKFSLEIFKKLKERSNTNNFKMFFIGDGELKEVIHKQIVQYGLDKDVVMLGLRTDIHNLLNMFDLYIMPSKYEGVSVALIEAQAAGLPCLVSETACAPEVIVSSQIESAKLTDSIDVWVDKIENNIRKKRCVNSADIVRNSGYSIKSIIEKLDCKYLELLKMHK